MYLFVECNIIKSFWKEINQWLLYVTGINISLNNVEMILGLEVAATRLCSVHSRD